MNASTTDLPSGPPEGTIMLRQSASCSGISALRGGEIIDSPLSGGSSRSAGKPVRFRALLGSVGGGGGGAKISVVKSLVNRCVEEPRIEGEEDSAFRLERSVQVLIRARPISSAEIAEGGNGRCVRQEDARTVSWLGHLETRFSFDHVAGEFVTQEEIFRVAGSPMVDNCMAGYNSCMFAYGQSGSGKTHTMHGDIGDFNQQPNENRGMTPRVFEYLFAKIQKEEEAQKHGKLKYKCRCSFLEIYNEEISDLLEPSSTNLQMREDSKIGVCVEGLLEIEVQNVQDVLHLLLLGATNRKVAASNMNRESSRSHSVFTCVIESQWECDSMINFRVGRLNLVDLAGSERQKATDAGGERLPEAASINKSLSNLGHVIMVLIDIANGKQRHVPYRDSKLTFLLQDSLGGNSKTTFIANISPSTCASPETLSTLKFAQRAKSIQNNAVINEEACGDVKGLQENIQQLKDGLAQIRNQSISRTPSVRVSDTNSDLSLNNYTVDSKDGVDPLRSSTEGSVLQFGRAVLGPTALSHKIKTTESQIKTTESQIKTMDALLADALRKEKLLVKTSVAEIEHRLVKQRQDETCLYKSLSKSKETKTSRLEAPSETFADEIIFASQESQPVSDQCNNLDHMRLAVENSRLQEQLHRSQEYDAIQKREAMVQDFSNLRDKLLDMLDRNISVDCATLPQQNSMAVELAAERQVADILLNEVESYRRDLSECRMKLQTSLESNERMTSELGALRLELEISQDECRKHRQELGTLQGKACEVECLEVQQAQHEQFMLELKTELQKSEEKAEQESSRRSQLEQHLEEALLESTNLQRHLQWTRDSLEEAKALLEILQRNEPVLETGNAQAFMIGQLQAEIIDMHARLEDERKRGIELEEQIANNGKRVSENEQIHKRNLSTESCDASGRRRVRHHDESLQLQMELDTIDGVSPSTSDCIEGYRWEEGTRDDEGGAKDTVTIMELQLDMKALEEVLVEERRHHNQAKASCERLLQQLEDTEAKLNAEKVMVEALTGNSNVSEIDYISVPEEGKLSEGLFMQAVHKTGEMAKMQDALVIARELSNLERQALVTAVADAEQRYMAVKKELEVTHDEFQFLEERTQKAKVRERVVQIERLKLEEELKQHLEADNVLANDLQNQIKLKEEEIVKLKEQAAQEQEDWVLEKSDLLVAVRELESRCMEKNQTIKSLQRTVASLQGCRSNNFYEEPICESAGGLRNMLANQKLVQLEKKIGNMTEALNQLTTENAQLQRQMQVLQNDTEDARHLVGQKEEEFAAVQRKLADMEDLLEQESSKMKAIALSINEAARSEENWIHARELLTSKFAGLQSCVGYSTGKPEVELARTQVLLAGSEGRVKLLSEMVTKMRNDSVYEKENLQGMATESEQEMDVVKSTDRPRRKLSDNRKLPSCDGSSNNSKQGEKLRQEVVRTRAEIAKLRSKLYEKDNTILNARLQLTSATTHCKEMEVLMDTIVTEKGKKLQSLLDSAIEELQTAKLDAKKYRTQVQQCESEMERLTMLLLETEERQTKAEQSWMTEKVEFEIHRHETELEALKLPARFAQIDKWQRQLSEADKLIKMLVKANEKSKQECSLASAEADVADKVVQELLKAVALTKDELDSTMGHVEGEIRALVAETQLLKTDIKQDILNLRKTQPVLVDDIKRSMKKLPSVKGLESDRRPWEQQSKAVNYFIHAVKAIVLIFDTQL